MSETKIYKKMYLELFHAVTETVEELDIARGKARHSAASQGERELEKKVAHAVTSLRKAQQKTAQICAED